MFTITTFFFQQITIILVIIKTRTKNLYRHFWHLVLIYAVCFKWGTRGAAQLVTGKFTVQNTVWEMRLCQISDLKYVAFDKILIKYSFFPVQFPVILLVGLLGNPPARICGWRTTFLPSTSSFPQHTKTENMSVSCLRGNLIFRVTNIQGQTLD